jgi:hypothetical protein
MKKKRFFVLFLLVVGLTWCQQITITQQSHLHGGSAYLKSDNPTALIGYHAITVGQVTVGSTSSPSYNMDFGTWSFYKKEPDAPVVSASDGDPSIAGIEVSFTIDPLSPPATLIPPVTCATCNIGGYPNSEIISDTWAITRDGQFNYLANINDNPFFYNDPASNSIWPGIIYSYGITIFNSFGVSKEGYDSGFMLPNGIIGGTVTTPGPLPGQTGNPVNEVEIQVTRTDGQPIGNAINFDGFDDYLYSENVYGDLLEDEITFEFWFKNNFLNPGLEYFVDMGNMLSIYQQDQRVHITIGNTNISSDIILTDSYWHHISITKGNRGACLRESEDLDDTNQNGSWDEGESYTDTNENEFWDQGGVINDITLEQECVSEIEGELFTWDLTYYTSGLKVYFDGELEIEDNNSTSEIESGTMFYLGRNQLGTAYFSGILDDIRIWKNARIESEINLNKDRMLTGTEDGLIGYWKMDEGMLNKSYNLVLVDKNNDGELEFRNNFSIFGNMQNTWWTTDVPPQHISGFTNNLGQYELKNIPYESANTIGTQFTVTPYKPNHDFFNPEIRQVTIRRDVPEQYWVDFTDESLFTVDGNIFYQNTNCNIDSAEIYVKFFGENSYHSTAPETFTDDEGRFSVNFEPEKTGTIIAVYKNHVFQNSFTFQKINNDASIDFIDLTKKTAYGNVSAGICKTIDIGPYDIIIDAVNSCVQNTTENHNGNDFNISGLPPIDYTFQIIPKNYNVQDLQNLTVSLDDYEQIESQSGQTSDNRLEFVHFPPIVLETESVINSTTEEIIETACNDGTYIFEQGEDYKINLKLKEKYAYIPQNECHSSTVELECSQTDECTWVDDSCISSISYEGECAMTSLKMSTIDNITGLNIVEPVLIETEESGEFQYFFTAREPNIVADFRQKIEFYSYDSNDNIGRSSQTDFWAYVPGVISDPDQVNANTTTSQIPFFVLRDPPGDASFSYLSEEQQICQTISLTNGDVNSDSYGGTLSLGAGFECHIGFSLPFGGPTFSTTLDIDVTADFNSTFTTTVSNTDTDETTTCFTVSNTYSTSDDENFIGSDGDVFVGAGISLNFGKAINQSIYVDPNTGECTVNQDVDYLYGITGFENTYMHTQSFIENTMIPQLEAQENGDGTFQAQADYWSDLIAMNEESKNNAIAGNATNLNDNSNFSLIDWSSGIIFEYSSSSESTYSSSHEMEFAMDEEFADELGISVNSAGYVAAFAELNSTSNNTSTTDEQTNVTTNGFVFSDDDPGDHFVVAIKEDPIWGMPVYELQSGQSECPWEEGTVKRFDPILGVDNSIVEGIVETEGALFYFELVNNSQSTPPETKDYMFRLRNDSNPLGAVVLYGGEPLIEPVQISIMEGQLGACFIDSVMVDTDDQDDNTNSAEECANMGEVATWQYDYYVPGEVQAPVVIYKEPSIDEYNYENLVFELYPSCEEGNEELTSSKSVTVRFEKPCTNLSLSTPSGASSWVLNGNQETEQLQIVISGYEFVSGNNIENLDEISIYYDVFDGEEWIPFSGATADLSTLSVNSNPVGNSYIFNLDMSILPDGEYKLIAEATCSAFNKSYSNILEGVKDLQIPLILADGLQPSNGQLLGGEEISVTYEESLDCEAINSNLIGGFNATNLSLNTPYSMQEPSLNISCVGNKISISFSGTVGTHEIENDNIRIAINNIRDQVGNIDTNEVSWEFIVNQNPISWATPLLQQDIYAGEDNFISIQLNNIGGSSSSFSFGELFSIPDWLTLAPYYGWLNAQGEAEISLYLDPDMYVGSYYETIYAETPGGFEPLILDLDILCKPPEWEFYAPQYNYSMNVIAQLSVDENQDNEMQDIEISTDTYDKIIAVIDGEIRGIGELVEFPAFGAYFVYLDIWSNQPSGENVEFRMWDNSQCQEMWEIDTNLVFIDGDIVGQFDEPITLNATGAIAQNISANQGWTWLSLNLENESMTVSNLMANTEPSEEDGIYGPNSEFSQYDVSTQSWVGTLSQLNNNSMYMLEMQNTSMINSIGYPVNPDLISINYDSGWNWIGYTPQLQLPINTALINMDPALYDVIKGQEGFSQFAGSDFGWVGTLNYLYPGNGYMLNTSSSGSFNYPVNRQSLAGNEMIVNTIDDLNLPWQLNYEQYQYSISAILNLSEEIDNPENWLITAFLDDEIRGISELQYINELEEYRSFMTIYSSDQVSNISIKLYDLQEEILYRTQLFEMPLLSNSIFGDIFEPIILNQGFLEIDGNIVPEQFALYQNYPNPFNPTTKINYEIPKMADISIEIFDITGVLVWSLNKMNHPPGFHSIEWHGINNDGKILPSSIYILQLRTQDGSFISQQKMLLVK